MTAFQYEALKLADRSRISGIINAGNEKEARELLREQELVPTKLQLITSTGAGGKQKDLLSISLAPLLARLQKVGEKEKIAFCRNMAMMVKAGIPVTEGLLYFENYTENEKLRKIVSMVRQDILSGSSFSQALERQKGLFNDIAVNVIKAGEASGELERTLERLTEIMVKAEKLKAKISSASVYPLIVLGIVGLVLLLMFLLVLPTFANIYKQMNVKLPLITQIMIGISNLLRVYWMVTFPALGFSLFGLYKYITSSGGKLLIDNLVLKIPVLGNLMRFVNNSHYVSTLLLAFSAGVPITECLYLSAQTVNNIPMRAAFSKVSVKIQAGHRLGSALSETGMVPDLVLLMISTGEESGALESMLRSSYEYLEEEVNQKVEILTAMMEPLMLLVLGVVVGTVALSIYLPMFGIYDKIH